MSNQAVSECIRVKQKVSNRIKELRREEQDSLSKKKQAEHEEQRLKRHALGGALHGAKKLLKGALNAKQHIRELDKKEAELQRAAQDADREADSLQKQLFTLDFWIKQASSNEQSDMDEATRHAHEIERSMR